MIWTIAIRELQTRGKSKGFIVITAILFAAVIGGALAISFLGGGDDPVEYTIGVTGDGVDYTAALETGTDLLKPTVQVVTGDGEALVNDGEIDVLFDGSTLTWEGFPNQSLDSYVRSIAQQVQLGQRATDLDVGPSELSNLLTPIEIGEVRLDGSDTDFAVRLATAAASGFATFMLLQTWGAFIMMGVIEEKSSKVIEILLSHVQPSTLLSGKVLGLGVLALVQMIVVVIGMVVGLSLVEDIQIPTSVWGTVPLVLVTFLLGFGFYATAFAAVGSMVSRQEDATTAQLPAMLPLLAGYAIAAASFGNPDNPAAVIGMFIPFTSPVLLPFRNAMTDVPTWQVAISLAILAASIVLMVKLGGRIYRYSLLRSGTRVSFSEAWKNRNQVGF